jgi:hypothetical protein
MAACRIRTIRVATTDSLFFGATTQRFGNSAQMPKVGVHIAPSAMSAYSFAFS